MENQIDKKEANHEIKLIITADDFGASKNINEGILLAVKKGAISTISALTNFTESLPELKRKSLKYPEIGIGVHLNVVTGRPILALEEVHTLVDDNGNFYCLEEFLKRVKNISIQELKNELRAQITALSNHDIEIDHLSDQCGVLSLISPFFKIITDLALEFEVPVRSPIIAGIECPKDFSNSSLKKKGRQIVCKLAISAPFKALGLAKYCTKSEMNRRHQVLHDLGIRHPDLFIECFWGDPSRDNLFRILSKLPEGCSEMVVHLGSRTRQDVYPSGLDLDYFTKREQELESLTDTQTRKALSSLNINVVGYSHLNR